MKEFWLFISVLMMVGPVMAVEPVDLQITPVTPVHLEQRGSICFADFGEDAYANLEVRFQANVPAATMKVRLGEKLAADGTIDRKPPGSVIYREVLLKTQPGKQVYRLSFPVVKRHENPAAVKMPADIGYVTPFRYAEIEGSPQTLDTASLRQLTVHGPFHDSAASFECSDPTLNAVWKLCHHTMKATTAFGIYIDGERERIPYEADAYINQLSHYACDLDPRIARVTFAHLLEKPTWPTEWSFHMPMIAAADYQATGDPVLAEAHYEALKKKLLSDRARPDGLLRAYAIVDWPAAERDGYNEGQISPKNKLEIGPEINTVVNAFYYHALRQMVLLANATGHHADALAFDETSKKVFRAFQATFFDAKRGIYIDGEGSSHASLHANMFPLAFGLVPAEYQKQVLDFVEFRGMACSVYGAQYLLESLFAGGRADYAIRLMASRGERSWWHMIEQGSTMTLEAWDEKVKPNLTWNHAWGAAPANILARFVLGVRPQSPGYQSILIQPQIGSLKWVKGKVPTPKGQVEIDIRRSQGFELRFQTPAGTSARVVLPADNLTDVLLDGKPLSVKGRQPSQIIDGVGPGKHSITAKFSD